MKERILLIIPAYNEEENILKTCREIDEFNKKNKRKYDYVVINDGSRDKTGFILDKNNINNIELVNLSDSVTTMYPMLNDNFEEIASAVKINGSTQNITYSADSKYTSSMILSGIKNALDKAVVTGAK